MISDSIRQDHSSVSADHAKAEQRSEIARQVEEYLARGGQVQQIPAGQSGEDPGTVTIDGKRRHRWAGESVTQRHASK